MAEDDELLIDLNLILPLGRESTSGAPSRTGTKLLVTFQLYAQSNVVLIRQACTARAKGTSDRTCSCTCRQYLVIQLRKT